MEYSIQCPSPCNYEIKVEANSDDEAVGKIMKVCAAHKTEAHPDMKVSEEQMRSMVRSNMKRGVAAAWQRKTPDPQGVQEGNKKGKLPIESRTCLFHL